jgi:DnaJ homolog subfamily C member 13
METEYVNKSVILKIGGQGLVHGLVSALLQDSSNNSSTGNSQQEERTIAVPVSDLILMVTSDILQGLLCSFHDTTSPEVFAAFIQALGMRYRALLATLRSQTAPFVIENTALLMHLLSTHAPETNAKIRDAALSSGILLSHFYAAIFSPLEGQRFLSRYLCGLWLSGPMDCPEKRLLQRMLPHGFMSYLNMPVLSKMEQEQLDAIERDADKVVEESSSATTTSTTSILPAAAEAQGAGGTNTARLRARMALARSTQKAAVERMENFRIFFHVLTQDSQLADLIWNQQTRRELRIALESEIQYVEREREARGHENIAWNHQQFRVHYHSLDNEIKVGNVYMRLWLQAGDGFIKSWEEPLRLFELLFRRFLCEIDRNTPITIMCIRCLERLYAIHSSAIGPFSDVIILVHSMASTKSIETQHRLLQLLATLLGVTRKDDDDDAAANIPPDNAEQLLNTESIGLLCQFVAWGHTNGVQVENLLSRTLAANSMRLITDGSSRGPGSNDKHLTGTVAVPKDEACPPVWFVAATGRIPPPPELVRGPFRVSDLIKMMDQGDLSPFDLVTASCVEDYDESNTSSVQEAHIDTGKWKRLNQVWQLRWQLCTDGNKTGIYSPSDVSLMAIKSLQRLIDLHKSLDSSGVPYIPIPIAKRILSGRGHEASICDEAGASPLSILSQALLCNDGRVVDESAKLLFKLLEYNDDAMPKFYLTGAFFFALGYHGSNFIALARLLESTHLRQHFRSGFAAAANKRELAIRDRSILGHLLPEGLLFILVNYGFDRFAKVFVSNADTPEVIWTLEMRKHLVDMIAQHLGDFPRRLFENNTSEYEYCPIPAVAYKRLQKEIFCHNYYLENLCDEERFPDW